MREPRKRPRRTDRPKPLRWPSSVDPSWVFPWPPSVFSGLAFSSISSPKRIRSSSMGFPLAPRRSPSLPVSVAASSPRRPMWVPTWWVKSRLGFPKTIRETLGSPRTTSVTTSAISPVWERTFLNHTSAPSLPPLLSAPRWGSGWMAWRCAG
ncbi:MAG: hypothetical protein A4E74_01369 [Syntrophus sp. PtaB.Bin075]|nr:MAG: hypothetical protein A4E74_01369 [Syntrophus sp. PtaB.Bin075]